MIAVLGAFSLVLVGLGVFYFVALISSGLTELRRTDREGPADPPAPIDVYFLVPALNEEAVIEATIANLLEVPDAHVVLVDDASDDATVALATAAGDERLTIVRRSFPDARSGKGEALNAGFVQINAMVDAGHQDPERVLVVVMDADGRLSPGALTHVTPLFDDPHVGGAQLGVRIANRSRNVLTIIQDVEFWGVSAVAQFGRNRSGTVSLGGNGQFTRLAALRELGDEPWSGSLTEDLDLSVRLLLDGWTLASTSKAFVRQEAVDTVQKLLVQRTRWYQGHMTCVRRLPSLWASPNLSNVAVSEISFYLLIPWIFVLPWSLTFQLALWEMVRAISQSQVQNHSWERTGLLLCIWYITSFFPAVTAGYLYWRQEDHCGRLRAFVLGHVMIVSSYFTFIACWRALFRMLLKRTNWNKTARRPATAEELPPAAPSPAA